MPDTESLWNGDVNEAVVKEWIAETTPFERVREVLRSTTTPQYARELAARARVSEPTARKHLSVLAETGLAETVDAGRGTRYKRSRQTVAMERISDLHSELSRKELVDAIRNLRAQIRDYQDEHDATGPDDLAIKLDSAETSDWVAVEEWRTLERNLNVVQAALALYDFDPDTSEHDETPGDGRTRGAFARENDVGTPV